MARAVELAAVVGADRVDAALGLAAIAGRFADGDLASIIDHLAAERAPGEVVIADEAHSAQPGTSGWARLGRGRRDDDAPPAAPGRRSCPPRTRRRIRQVLAACSDLITWAEADCGPRSPRRRRTRPRPPASAAPPAPWPARPPGHRQLDFCRARPGATR